MKMFSPAACFLVISLWTTFLSCQGEPCVTWEEGIPHVLTCTSSVAVSKSMVFQVETDEGFTELASCDPSGKCTSKTSNTHSLVYESKTDEDGTTVHLAHLIVANYSRNETAYRCLIDGRSPGICEVEFFVRPKKPVCDPPSLIVYNSQPYLNLTCVTEKTYPPATAIFKYNGPTIPNNTDVRNSYENYPSPISPENFGTKAEHLLSLAGWSTGRYEFLVLMFPTLANITEETALDTGDVTTLDTVNLEAPTTVLSDDCPIGDLVNGGYIMSGSGATCKCKLQVQGYPPGHAQWYTEGGKQVGNINEEDESSTLTVSYNPTDPKPRFECRAETVLAVAKISTVPFSPQFAYGPNSVVTELSSSDTFDLCPSESHTITVVCKVPFEEVTPQVFFTFLVDNDILEERKQGTLISNFYVYNFNFRPSSGGNHRVICRAANSMFSQLSVEKSENVQVREPPPSPPLLTTSNQQSPTTDDNKAYITDGEDVIVTCRVDGGFPQVSEMTLTCGSKSNTAPTKVVALEFKVTKSLNGQTCYCSAKHVSGCYQQDSMVLLQVQDPKPETTSPQIDIMKIGLGAGLGGAVLIILVIVVISIVVCRRRQRRNNNDHVSKGHKNDGYDSAGPSNANPYAVAVVTPGSGNSHNAYETPADHYDLISFGTASIFEGNNRFSDTDAWSVDFPHRTGDSGTYIDPV